MLNLDKKLRTALIEEHCEGWPYCGEVEEGRSSINGPAEISYIAGLDSPEGCEEIWFDTLEQAEAFNADPDMYAANYFGLTLPQYYEWLGVSGRALCAATAKNGKPCRCKIKGLPFVVNRRDAAQSWLKHHRNGLCEKHKAA